MKKKMIASQEHPAVQLYAEKIRGILEVKEIQARVNDRKVELITTIEDYDDSVEDRIYDIEMELLDAFPNVEFDFFVFPLSKASTDDVAGNGFVRVSPSDSKATR